MVKDYGNFLFQQLNMKKLQQFFTFFLASKLKMVKDYGNATKLASAMPIVINTMLMPIVINTMEIISCLFYFSSSIAWRS
jgi:hypothetical protein